MNDEERMKQLLKQAVRPVEAEAESAVDVWPAVLGRIHDVAATGIATRPKWVWLDGALLAGLLVLGVSFPATIPLFLYYL